MPVIARFYGIVIKMYFSQSELLDMWQNNEFKQLPGLE